MKASGSYYISVCIFIILILGIASSLYYSALKIDYVWRWFRIPQYFVYQDQIEIRAEEEGEIESIIVKGDKAVIHIKSDEKTRIHMVSTSDMRVDEGDLISPGDILATYNKWRIGILVEGLWLTLKVSVIAIVFGIFIGLFAGIARISSSPALKWSAVTYIEFIRGSPLLVQIFIWYFVLGTLINNIIVRKGMGQISPLWFGVAALACFAGAYVAEMVRAGIQSIHFGQIEAAKSLGMTYVQSMRYIILPQALRRILPPLAGQFISLIKDSSLLGLIAIRELTKATREVITTSLQPFELWFVCAILYLVLTFSLSMFVQYLERRTQVT